MTASGRGVAVVLMLVGVGLIGIITANVAAFFVTATESEDRRRLAAIEGRLERIETLLASIADRSGPADLVADRAEPDAP